MKLVDPAAVLAEHYRLKRDRALDPVIDQLLIDFVRKIDADLWRFSDALGVEKPRWFGRFPGGPTFAIGVRRDDAIRAAAGRVL